MLSEICEAAIQGCIIGLLSILFAYATVGISRKIFAFYLAIKNRRMINSLVEERMRTGEEKSADKVVNE